MGAQPTDMHFAPGSVWSTLKVLVLAQHGGSLQPRARRPYAGCVAVPLPGRDHRTSMTEILDSRAARASVALRIAHGEVSYPSSVIRISARSRFTRSSWHNRSIRPFLFGTLEHTLEKGEKCCHRQPWERGWAIFERPLARGVAISEAWARRRNRNKAMRSVVS